MKKYFSLIFAIVFVIILCQNAVFAGNNAILNNNTSSTSTSFSITTAGNGRVFVKYVGIPGVTSGASISVVIKKITFLWFTTTVVDETYNIAAESYSNTYYYDLSSYGSGTYRCNVTYTVSGSGGADDVIPFEDTASY